MNRTNRALDMPLVLALAALLTAPAATPPGVSSPPTAAAQEPAASASSPPVPQTFDWWTERGIPAETPWGQPIDTAATRRILSWTTEPEYTSPLVDHLPARATVVSPSDHFGQPIGAPGVLHRVDEIYGYFDALSGSTGRVRFQRLGTTEQGRRFALAQVGSEENLARLDEIKAAHNALADPRRTTEAEAGRIIEETPPVYLFWAGLHSTETGHPEMVMEMAYRLAVSDDPIVRRIRENVVVFIVPVTEPDGRDRSVDWHRRYNMDVYDSEDRVPGPPYWGEYIFHDNNRDGLGLAAALTRQWVDLVREWSIPLAHDLHESVPYLYSSTGLGPYNPTVDPITVTEWQWISNYEVSTLTAHGMPGVWNHAFYNGWYPGYLMWAVINRNGMAHFYETFGNSVPNTMVRELGGRSTSREWYRPSPPRDSTLWSMRNNTNYMQSGALTALELVAENRTKVLGNFWKKSKNSLNAGRDEAPFAWVVPADQDRRGDVARMLEMLRRQGIELHRASEEGTFSTAEGEAARGDGAADHGEGRGADPSGDMGGGPAEDDVGDGADDAGALGSSADPEITVRDGDFVIRMDQPYRNFILTLMREQEFPEDAPAPYDDVAWTYPLMFNAEAHPVAEKRIQEMEMEPVSGEVRVPGRVIEHDGEGVWLVQPRGSSTAYRARLALGDVPMRVAEDSLDLGEGLTLSPGAWIVSEDDVSAERMRRWAADEGMVVHRAGAEAVADAVTHAMELPRIAVLHTWSSTQAEGWMRYTFDRDGIEYDYVGEDRIGELGRLRDRWDVIVFGHQGSRETAKEIFQGIDPEYSPLTYTRTEEFPSHGVPDSTEDMTGGMGFAGLQALWQFVEDGGTLLAIGSALTVPVEFGFLRDVELEDSGEAFIPGSLLRAQVTDPSHPLAYGYDETFPLYHQWGPYFEVDEDVEAGIAVEYADAGELLLSGVARNAGPVGGQPAVYSEKLGEGYVVVYGFDAFHRNQNFGNQALVWNALMNWNDLDARAPEAGGAVTDEGEPGR